LSRAVVEFFGDGVQVRLGVQGEVGAAWQVLAEQAVFSFDPRCQGERGSQN
jgi:hypothetical protein